MSVTLTTAKSKYRRDSLCADLIGIRFERRCETPSGTNTARGKKTTSIRPNDICPFSNEPSPKWLTRNSEWTWPNGISKTQSIGESLPSCTDGETRSKHFPSGLSSKLRHLPRPTIIHELSLQSFTSDETVRTI